MPHNILPVKKVRTWFSKITKLGLFIAFPLIVFTFAAQSSIFPIYDEMLNAGAKHKDVTTVIKFLFCGHFNYNFYWNCW